MLKSLPLLIYHKYKKRKIILSERKALLSKICVLKEMNQFANYPFPKKDITVLKYPIIQDHYYDYLSFYYSSTRNEVKDYIPDITYILNIEPFLNSQGFLNSISDKNAYDLLFPNINTPKTILRKIDNIYYDEEYNLIGDTDRFIKSLGKQDRYEKLVLKPSLLSGGGKGILLFQKHNNELKSNSNMLLEKSFLDSYPDFILQEFLEQHNFCSNFNLSSINTLRLLTFRSLNTGKIKLLHTLFRVGSKGSFMDHDNLGGYVIGVTETGFLRNSATNFYGIKTKKVNEIDLTQSLHMPFFEKTKNAALKMASHIFYANLLAFDFAIDRSGNPLLIEINTSGNGISQYQLNNGSLFGKYTDEILYHVSMKATNKYKI